MDKGFPRLIKDDFPGIEPQVDAVLQAFGKNFMSSTVGALGVLGYHSEVYVGCFNLKLTIRNVTTNICLQAFK